MDFEWLQAVDELKARAVEFMNVFSRLESLEPVARADPVASIRYDNLMGVALAVRNRISYLTGLIDGVFDWFSSNGSEPSNTVAGMGQLGILWVPVAVVAGAVAYIVSWLSDAYIETEQLEAVQNLIAQGVSPADAWKLIREEQDKGIIGNLMAGIQSNFLLFAGLGLAAYYLPRYIKRNR